MLRLGTKAETLYELQGKMQFAEVLPQITFSVNDWRQKREDYWAKTRLQWEDAKVIVRSSALSEDTQESSKAGKFESVGDVDGRESFNAAVEKVIESFDDTNIDNQILVQPMLKNVKYCGVAFTLDPNTMGNYYVINYDESGSTSSITQGNGRENKLLYVFKQSKPEAEEVIVNLCKALEELEKLFGKNNLDVEFAVTREDKLYIFQVRTLCVRQEPIAYDEQKQELIRIEEKIRRDQTPKPFLCGKKTVYGVMPDWNPAEMIGIRPKPLAMSLYEDIITDNVWAYQRHNYGYRNLRSFPLMVDFCGLPYIDVRVSFNSFIPAQLDEEISEKLVNYYMDRLESDPSKHDKVEFDIVFSCYSLDLPKRIRELYNYGFTKKEVQKIVDSLRNVTNEIINHNTGLWKKDYDKIKILEKRYEEILNIPGGGIEKVYWLLEDCKRYGTLPFAGLARAAFIAVQMLQSMVAEKILSEQDYHNFMNDVATVSSNMSRDYHNMSKQSFLKKYGHLRPGTYDINSKRYDEAFDLYFDWKKRDDKEITTKEASFRLSLEQMNKLTHALKVNGLNDDILGLMGFIKNVIEGREYGKFIFTKNLSKAIQIIGEIGERYGFSREDCSYMDIRTIQRLYASTRDIETELRYSIEKGKHNFAVTEAITLPPLVTNPSEVWSFYYPDTEINYITLNKAQGNICILENAEEVQDIRDKILLIPSADPGYDWIFSHGIKGFITKYGGANSHMAIRAGELGIPAAIGVGEKQFEEYKKSHLIEIDAQGKNIKILR